LILLPGTMRDAVSEQWIDDVGDFATLVWRGHEFDESELEPHELCIV